MKEEPLKDTPTHLSFVPSALLCYLVPLILITLFTAGSLPAGKRFGLFAFGIVLSSLGAACLYFCLRFFSVVLSSDNKVKSGEETKILNLQEEFVFPLNPENRLSLEKEKHEWKSLAEMREKEIDEKDERIKALEEALEDEKERSSQREIALEETKKGYEDLKLSFEDKDEMARDLKAKVQDLSYELKTLLRLSEVK